MPTNKETLTTKVLVKPEWDRQALKKMEKDFGGVTKRLASMKTDWAGISKSSGSAVAEIAKISKAAAAMSGSLSDATKKSVKEMAALAKQLQEAKKRAEELKRKASTATDPRERASASSAASDAEKQMMGLTRQLKESQKAEKASINEIKQSIKARKLEREQLKKAAAYTGKDFRKEFASSFSRARTGGVKGALSGIHGGVKSGSKYSSGVSARAQLSGEGGGAAALAKFAPVLSGLAVGFAALIGFIAKASSAITGMNKALINGSGTANDFTTKTGAYTTAIDDLRKSTKDASLHLLKMGGNVEMTGKIVNSYMKDASGSIMKTRDAMTALGEGDTAKGIEVLAKNAMAYGKALGMEVTDVAGMMGKMESEVGLGARQTQNIMSNIVKAAATSNMPVSKFMDIFRATTPALELYTNRMEELTGVIKMLSKNMSAEDVKKYMEAFKGFKGQSFLERVQHVLVAGIGKTDKILAEGFSKKADTLAVSLNDQVGEGLGDKFAAAFKKGDKEAMKDILIQAKSRGASAASIGEAQKLMGVEGDRRSGDALGEASALKGASMRDMAKIMEAEIQRLGGGKPGARVSQLKEQIAESRGWSQDQVDALNQFNDSMNLYQKSLQEYGTTVSKSMDDALKKVLAQKTGKTADQITPRDMAKASQDDIAAAAELSNKSEKTQKTALDLATENADATVSLGEKLDNVIGFILEQIYEKVDGVLKVLNNIFNSILDWISGDGAKAKGKAAIDKYNVSGYSAAHQKSFGDYKDTLKGGVEAGKSGMALASTAGDYYKSQYEKMKAEPGGGANAEALKTAMSTAISKAMDESGMGKAQKTNNMKSVTDALDKGDFGKAMQTLVAFKGGRSDTDALLKFGQDVLPKALTEADKKAADTGGMRRTGTSTLGIRQTAVDPAAMADASDTVALGKKISDMGADADKAFGAVADAASPAASATPATTSTISSSPAAKVSQEQTKAVTDVQKDAATDQKKATGDVYDGIQDVASILKRGIRIEPSFLNGPYAKTIRDSTLLSFKDALMEFGIMQAKMQNSPAIRSMVADQGDEVIKAGGLDAIMGADVSSGNPLADLRKTQTDQVASKQTGGPIPDTGNYRLHRGEYVVPAMPAGGSGDGGGGGTVNANVVINGSGLSPKQLEGAVFGAMDRISRRR
jgi:predicted  nucleic acid-binding Zn-ribbon protein